MNAPFPQLRQTAAVRVSADADLTVVAVDTTKAAGRALMRSALDGLCAGSTPIDTRPLPASYDELSAQSDAAWARCKSNPRNV